MAASCAGCGACCAVIGVGITIEDVRHTFMDILRGEDFTTRDGTAQHAGLVLQERAFLLANWSPVTPEEAQAIDPRIAAMGERSFYVCGQFDAQTRRCNAHERKPSVCSGFPWYGGQPNNYALAAFPRCSYWHDVPRDQWPEGIDPLPSPEPEPENCC